VSKARVLVAMSGGVDSSVAAARLVDAGYETVGCTLHLWDYPDEASDKARCCAPEDQYDARRVADALGFPHFAFDRRELFAEKVVAPFVEAYLAGETPSPCTACNRGVKLAELFSIADRLGASHVATGHYARVVEHDGELWLAAGKDATKDQSYFLYATPPEQLARMLFPLGESTKAEVRAEALARALPGAGKGESQELCFVGDGAGAYAAFVEARAEGRAFLVYVGATWCEPCQRFHRAAEAGAVDATLGPLTLLEFDLDRDKDRLEAAGYASRYIPLFALPAEAGRATDRRVEGSIKGEGAVAELVPRLRALLSGR
jgi:7-cyano-7-deazaguanine synthase in queuosine biosynthesis